MTRHLTNHTPVTIRDLATTVLLHEEGYKLIRVDPRVVESPEGKRYSIVVEEVERG